MGYFILKKKNIKMFKIGKFKISKKNKTLIIAEIGQSHLGSINNVRSIINKVSKAGANIIKFQTHLAADESTINEPFRVKNRKFKNRIDYWKQMEFTKKNWIQIISECNKKNLQFISSPFSDEAVDLLKTLKIKAWKIGSGEFFSNKMIEKIIEFKQPIIISTGLSKMNEIEKIVNKFKKNKVNFILMQCTSLYPSKIRDIGINILDIFKKKFNCAIGLSDHTGSIYPSIYAMCKGASAIEVHVGDKKEKMNPDSSSSISFNELKELSRARDEIYIMRKYKQNKKKLTPRLSQIKKIFTKSCTVKKKMLKGEILKESDITVKKPGTGVPYEDINLIVGKKLKNDIYPNRLIKLSDLKK
jgi:N-acetylneuraminate synthase